MRPLPRSRLLVVLAVLVTLVAVFGAVQLFTSSPTLEGSRYGYSLSVSTDATLENVTLLFPLPVSGTGESPLAGAVRNGSVDAPAGWQYDVVGTDTGPALRVRAAAVTAERQPDGRRYSSYQFSVRVPADHVVGTADPVGSEPTLMGAPNASRSEIPCPNVENQSPDETCYSFDTRVYAAYEAPPDTSVDVVLVTTGANRYDTRRGFTHYYERLLISLDGPQRGWVTSEGFAATEPNRTLRPGGSATGRR